MSFQATSCDKNLGRDAIVLGSPAKSVKNADFEDVFKKVWWRHHYRANSLMEIKSSYDRSSYYQVSCPIHSFFIEYLAQVNLPHPHFTFHELSANQSKKVTKVMEDVLRTLNANSKTTEINKLLNDIEDKEYQYTQILSR